MIEFGGEGIREPNHPLRMYIYAKYIDNLLNSRCGTSLIFVVVTSPEVVAYRPAGKIEVI